MNGHRNTSESRGSSKAVPAAPILWTNDQVGEYLRVSSHTTQMWRSQGSGPPYIKIGGRCFYDAEKLFEWVRSHEVRSTAESSVKRARAAS